MLDWQRLSQTEREREYSPSSAIGGNYQPFIAAYVTQSLKAYAQAQSAGGQWRELAYGNAAAQRIKLCVPGKPIAPARRLPGLLVFIHGGYWQELSARDSLFAAADCVANGHAFAAIDYTLAPAASLGEIVTECRAAVRALHEQAPALGFDANRIVVAGSSAGAHLAAMVAVDQAAPVLRAVILVSGIFDLEPLIGTSINHALSLTPASARQLSPWHVADPSFAPSIVCWGEVETEQFKRQSLGFARLIAQPDCFEIPRRNHFDAILELTDPNTRLGQRTLAFLEKP